MRNQLNNENYTLTAKSVEIKPDYNEITIEVEGLSTDSVMEILEGQSDKTKLEIIEVLMKDLTPRAIVELVETELGTSDMLAHMDEDDILSWAKDKITAE